MIRLQGAIGFVALLGLSACASFEPRSGLPAAEAAFRQGRYPEAERLGEAALSSAEQDKDGARAGQAAGFLAGLNMLQGRSARAEGLYRKALSSYEKLGQAGAAAATAYDLAGALSIEGKLDEAESRYRRSVELSSRAGAPPEELSEHLGGLCLFLETQGRYDDAEACLLRLVSESKKAGGQRAKQAQRDYDALVGRRQRRSSK